MPERSRSTPCRSWTACRRATGSSPRKSVRGRTRNGSSSSERGVIMNLWLDLKYAWRLMRKSWGYSLMCASVVALSVGLAVWTNALVYSQLFTPLGLPGSEDWYSVQLGPDAGARVRPSVDAYTW